MNKKLGQVSIPVALVLTAMAGVTTGLSSYYASQLSQSKVNGDNQARISVLESQTGDLSGSISEVKASLDRVDNKVDALLINRGINPNNVKDEPSISRK